MARPSKDSIDRFFEWGVDLDTKTLWMGSVGRDDDGESGVDHLMAERTIKGLSALDALRQEYPITILMNNPGGDVYHGIAIYDFVRDCKSPVEIKVYGHAMSMGSVILQAADRRLISRNSKLMLHYGQTWLSGDHPLQLRRSLKESELINEWMEQLYLDRIREKHPGYKLASLRDKLKADWYLSAEEAVEMGLADEVIGGE